MKPARPVELRLKFSLIVEDDAIFNQLKAPTKRVCGLDVPVPFSRPMELYVVPDRDKIIAAVRQMMSYPAK